MTTEVPMASSRVADPGYRRRMRHAVYLLSDCREAIEDVLGLLDIIEDQQSLLEKAGIVTQRRAESLALDEWARLWQVFKEIK